MSYTGSVRYSVTIRFWPRFCFDNRNFKKIKIWGILVNVQTIIFGKITCFTFSPGERCIVSTQIVRGILWYITFNVLMIRELITKRKRRSVEQTQNVDQSKFKREMRKKLITQNGVSTFHVIIIYAYKSLWVKTKQTWAIFKYKNAFLRQLREPWRESLNLFAFINANNVLH